MSKRRNVFSALTILALMLSLIPFAGESVANAQTPPAGTAVASDLSGPRYIYTADDGTVYFTEAGVGGNETIPPPPDAGPNATPIKRGLTGKVGKISPNGTKSYIVSNLPSYGEPGDAAGPAGIVYAGGFVWVAVGGAAVEAGATPLRYENSVVRIDPNSGAVTLVADIGAYEKANNPDKRDVNSNLYGMDLGAGDNLYVADAGGNCLYSVNPTNGDFKVVTCFAGIPIPAGTPAPPGLTEAQPVPTGVVGSTQGDVFVSLLSGYPFPIGGTKVVRVTPSGTVTDQITGLTMSTGIEIGPDSNFYVTELTTDPNVAGGPNAQPAPGRVTRVTSGGTKTVVASGLIAPNSVAFDKAGNMYVATGAAAPTGSIVRYNNIAPPPTSTPLPNTGPSNDTVTFPQTGFSLDGQFLDFWNKNGGLAVFGYPIDSARQNNGLVGQWLERNRFELHPENKAPYNVLLSRLGVDALARKGIDWNTLPKVSSAPSGCIYFKETGHSLCNDFMNYWSSNGLEFDGKSGKSYAESLALFGFPISEPKMETNSSGDTVMTQWFERARFEFHPNNPAQYRVLLGRLGFEMMNAGK